jgi:Mg/Co/Ni transporter MgtE
VQISNLVAPDLEEALKNNPAQAAARAEELRSADLAELIDRLPDELAVALLSALGETHAAAAFDAMEAGRRAELFPRPDRAKAARIADRMSPDERADLVQSLPEEVSADLMARLPRDASLDVRALLRYPEHTAGGRMTTDFARSPADRRARHRRGSPHRRRARDHQRGLCRRSQRHLAGGGFTARFGPGAGRPAAFGR